MNTSKIIKGAVGNGRYTVTAPIVKEDYGLYLKIEGVELPETYQVDFSNSENSGSSVTMIGNSDGVLIPHQFISTGKDVFAFLYHVGADYGRTVYKFRIPNKVRPDRTNEEPTPEEQSTIDQAISALNEAVAQTAQDVESADQSAQSAQGYAEQAEQARDTAQTYANNAQTSATSAQTSASQASASATASAQSASQSAQIKADVEDLADDARGYASASAQSASASANSASQAQGYAQSASGYASSAQTSANTASAKAQDASGYAQTASQKATESAQSATNAQGYAQTAEQAKTASQTAQGLAESARDSAIGAKDDAESARDDAVQAKEDAESAVASIADALDDKAPVITDTASGSIASFSDGADDSPLKSLVVDINPIQDLHGQDAPYPAGGGKNKVPSFISENETTSYGLTFTLNEDGSIRVHGTSTVTSAVILSMVKVSLPLTAGTYTFNCGITNSNNKIYCQVVNNGKHVFYSRYAKDTYTMSSDFTVTRLDIGCNASNGEVIDVTIYPQLELGSTATDYAPYENICPISGWTQVGVEQSEKNIINVNSETWDKYNVSERFWGSNAEQIVEMLNALKPGTYTFTFHEYVDVVNNTAPGTYGILLRRYVNGVRLDVDARLFNTAVATPKELSKSVTFTLTEDDVGTFTCVYLYAGFAIQQTQNSAKFYDLQIELGSTATPYSPYTGRSITIPLGQTVYGGHLDVVSGVMTVYPYYASYNGETLTGEWISDRDKYVSGTAPTIGAQVVNIGAQGVTVQLEPHEVASLYGVNNIWADSGDTEVEYRANTKAWVQRKITEAIASLT